MLTGLAILERELGRIEYERHQLERGMGHRSRSQVAAAKRQVEELEKRRLQTIRLLDELNEEYEDRTGFHAA